jgi:anaerobic magnesium-protoporphyrin IX monomethyl ester cyclase
MLATRGCPFRCTFCSSPAMWTTRYVVRPVEDIVDEIEHWIARYGIRNVDFEDLTAFIKRDWILAFCRELERRRVHITFQLPSGTRSEVLDREVLEALHRNGCSNLTYAPESGSVRTLVRIKKKIHLDRMLDSMRTAVDLGIVTKVNMVIGFPFEERRDVWQTIKFCLQMAWIGVEDIPLFPFIAYPGSAIYDDLEARGIAAPLNNEYFAALGFSNLRQNRTPSEHMSAAEITVYRTLGMILFIVAGYASHPSRFWRTARNLLRSRQESAVEERLDQLLVQPLRRAFGRPARARPVAAAG